MSQINKRFADRIKTVFSQINTTTTVTKIFKEPVYMSMSQKNLYTYIHYSLF